MNTKNSVYIKRKIYFTRSAIAVCLAVILLAGSAPEALLQVYAAQMPAYKEDAVPQITDLCSAGTDVRVEFYETDELQSSGSASFSIKGEETDYTLAGSVWAGNGSDYYFSLLNTAEKKLYLSLKKQADSFMTGTDDFQTTEVMRAARKAIVYIMPLISYDGLELGQMKKVFYCFLFENPQYYFIRNSVLYSESTKMMTVGLYEVFANGNTRAAYTDLFAKRLDGWAEQINESDTTVEKERLIHDMVCSYVSYDDTMATDDPDDKEMSQSCISAVMFRRSTVCTGYAQMFSLLCNRVGIECVTVTSAGHAWNKVRMGTVWYNVDCTWDDAREDDKYLNVTDEELSAEDSERMEHAMSEEWIGIAPPCTDVFDEETANGADVIANVPIPEQVSDVAAASREKGKISVRFAPVEECDGYTVQHAANANMTPSNKKDTEKASCVVSGLKSGKNCYIRVRGYALDSMGEKVYGAYSKKVKAAVK